MLKIRLLRVGKKHDPSYRMVVVDSKKAPRSGDYLEKVGFYDVRKKKLQLNKERIGYWFLKGAQVSDTVHNLLLRAGAIKGRKIDVSSKKKGKKKIAAQAAESSKEISDKEKIDQKTKETEEKKETLDTA